MATRKQKLDFAARRLKGFWSQYSKCKRGLIGLIMIMVFVLLAILAPFVAPFDPLNPQIYVGQYQSLGPSGGPRISSQLAKPAWYKYLPWIGRGETLLTENFYNLVRKYEITTGVYQTLQTFGSETSTDEGTYDTSLSMSHRISRVENITLTYENGTKAEMSQSDWIFAYEGLTRSTRDITPLNAYENNTKFSVTYVTGTDLVDNIKVVEDHKFTTLESFNQWALKTNVAPDLVSINYNTENGFAFDENSTENRGCVEISYGGATAPTEAIEVTLTKNFTYPFYEPPAAFWLHTSMMLVPRSNAEQNEWNNATLAILIQPENGSEFLVATRPKATNSTARPEYLAEYAESSDPAIARSVHVSPAEDGIFVSAGNYKFIVRVIIPPGSQAAKVYLDDVDCIIYGNVFGILGTDNGRPLPRDIFSMLIWGSRVSLFVGGFSAVFSTLIGLFLGLVSGYVGGLVDEGIMRFADLLLVLPTLPLFIILIVALRSISGLVSMWNVIIILTLFGWMGFARSVRSMVLSIRERSFIEAARASGAGRLHIINKHIVPNVFSLVYITLATAVPGAIITEASLSWLGLGDPRVASWGKILYDFNNSSIAVSAGLTEYWFWIFPACIAIALLATAFILVGYALDEILNPRLRERR